MQLQGMDVTVVNPTTGELPSFSASAASFITPVVAPVVTHAPLSCVAFISACVEKRFLL